LKNQDQFDAVVVAKEIDRIEVQIAAAFSVAALLKLRGDLSALIARMPNRRPYRPQRKRTCAARRQAEDTIAQFLISLKERGLRRGGGGRAANNRLSIRTLGVKKSLAMRWQRRVRGQPKAFAVVVAEARDFASAMALLDCATSELRGGAGDDQSRAIALARQMLAERHEAGGGLSNNRRARCRQLARMTEQQFIDEIFMQIELAKPPRQVVSDWAIDETGVLSREITAA
jgi:hypothetical protein